MKIGQLKNVLTSCADFAASVAGEENQAGLSRVVAILPANDDETAAAFIKRVKSNLKEGSAATPPFVIGQLDAFSKLLSSLEVKKSISDDLDLFRSLLTASATAEINTLENELITARDTAVQSKPAARKKTASDTTKPKSASVPTVKKIVQDYVETLRQVALNPSEFELIFSKLKSHISLHDDRIKEIANKLNNYSARTPDRPKTRDEAFHRILSYQHKKAGSESARLALESTPL